MSYIGSKDFLLEAHKGNVAGHAVVHKFGHGLVGTTLVPVTQTLDYKTPTTATALEFVSSSANDTSAGSGAREITIVGLDSSWNEVSQTLVTNGTTAVALTTNLTRLYRWYVSSSGTYATSTTGSHAGTLTIRGSGAGATWSTIGITPFPLGQSEIGCYSVPTGKTAYILSQSIEADSSKTVDVFFFKRENADDVTTPFSGSMRIVERFNAVQGGVHITHASAKNPMVGPCDIGYMAKVSTGTADVSVEFEILLVDN